mgnify:CR=1 FL=1
MADEEVDIYEHPIFKKLVELSNLEKEAVTEEDWAKIREMGEEETRQWFETHLPTHRTGWCLSSDYYYFATHFILHNFPAIGDAIAATNGPEAVRAILNDYYEDLHHTEDGPDEFNTCYLRGYDPDAAQYRV